MKISIPCGKLKKAVSFFTNLTSKDENAFNTFYLSWGLGGVKAHFVEHSTYAHVHLTDFDGEGEGQIVLNVYMMGQIVSRLGDGELVVSFEEGAGKVRLTYGQAKWDVFRLDDSVVMPVFTPDSDTAVVVSGDDFATTIGQVGPACEPKLVGVLQGINFVLKNKVLSVHGTDRYTMVRHQLPVDSAGEFNVIVRASMLMSLARLIDKGTGVRLLVEDGFFWVFLEDTVVRFACMAGTYPDMDTLYERDLVNVGEFKVADLVDQVSLCQSVFDKSDKIATMVCSFKGGAVTLESEGMYGTMRTKCENVSGVGEEMEICISSRFLYSYLRLIKDETIRVSCFGDSTLYLGEGSRCAGIQKSTRLN